MSNDFKSLLDQFDQEIGSRTEEIDESDAHDWWSLVYGWALGKGLDVDSADEFSRQANDRLAGR